MHSSQQIRESLLVFSDVHLGSDLNDCTQNVAKRTTKIDRDLVLFLAHYRKQKPAGDRWRMIIAGDFIDFIGITISPRELQLDTAPTEEEQEHGLGNSSEHARLKLRRVSERHRDVFEELAAFVAAGNALTLVHGNHDIEFHWDEVKHEFRSSLLEHARAAVAALDADAFLGRIEFSPWFFYRDGLVYIEHGHQYDPYCSTARVLAPMSPLDPRRIARGMTDVLLRFVVRPTHGMKEHGHEKATIASYIAFGVKLGLGGLVRLASRFVRAIFELFRLRAAHLSVAAKTLHAEHERRVGLLAEASRIGLDRLRALLSMQAQPITQSVRGILASVLLDRLALAVFAVLALLVVAIIGAFNGYAFYAAFGVLMGWALFHRHLCRQRHVDPAEALAAKAPQLARLFPAAFVVMGHTHVPVQRAAGDSTYINLGSWAENEEESPEGAYRAPRTHLVIHLNGEVPEAQLFTWESETGPRRFQTDASLMALPGNPLPDSKLPGNPLPGE